MRDLLVAGGGPVGLATALHAARAGLDVAVLERREGTIDKACGEGLMPGATASLADLGVRPPGHPITGIRYVEGDRLGGRVAEAPFRHGGGLGVRRTALHAALSAAVAAAGIPVVHRTVRSVRDVGDRVVVDGEVARYLVAADGLHSPVRRMLGLDRPVQTRRRFGQRRHVQVAPWTSFVEVHWSRVGEAYVTPVAPDEVGVAILTRERRTWAELLAAFPALAERLDGPLVSELRGAGPLRQRARRRAAGRVLLVGDAAGYVDALTGEGIALGLAQARAAVAALVADRPGRYELAARRLGWRHELLTQGLVTATRSVAVRDRLVPAAVRLPRVFGAAVDVLARPA
ncbi:NAD(P)/FAD-dependent oxidoreductase [Nocardioides sp.]|uniref:NAD(P)/FAD-dependent oxidoreductase n=1 Tax=Nocardioides sp. TaxID=35761 RepID=UPI0037838B83